MTLGSPNVQRLTVEQVTLSGISPGQNTIGITAIRSGLIDSQELSEVVLRARAITTIRPGATWKITRSGTWTGTHLYGWPAPPDERIQLITNSYKEAILWAEAEIKRAFGRS